MVWEDLDANALPATHAALDKGLKGENVSLPDGERQAFCAQLQAILDRLQPGENSSALADLRAHICS